ncbi:MAG: hypothetical protein NVSMB14_15230 [Isosphaeraceae bacterium]
MFARVNRTSVFETHGLHLQNGKLTARPRANSPITGLVVSDYRWEFRYSEGDEDINTASYGGLIQPATSAALLDQTYIPIIQQ